MKNKEPLIHWTKWASAYAIWRGMLRRCYDENELAYEWYGFRGIKVCRRWHKFKNFLEDMGRRPSTKYSIDRLDNDGNYEPGNCRWATAKQQRANRYHSKQVLTIETLREFYEEIATKPSI